MDPVTTTKSPTTAAMPTHVTEAEAVKAKAKAKERQREGGREKVPQTIVEADETRSDRKTDAILARAAGTNRTKPQ